MLLAPRLWLHAPRGRSLPGHLKVAGKLLDADVLEARREPGRLLEGSQGLQARPREPSRGKLPAAFGIVFTAAVSPVRQFR